MNVTAERENGGRKFRRRFIFAGMGEPLVACDTRVKRPKPADAIVEYAGNLHEDRHPVKDYFPMLVRPLGGLFAVFCGHESALPLYFVFCFYFVNVPASLLPPGIGAALHDQLIIYRVRAGKPEGFI